MSALTSSSQGNVQAIPLIIVAVLTLTIAVLSSQLILNKISANTTQDEIDQDTLNKASTALGVFDLGIVFVNASFFIASFILVYRIPSNPIFVVPAILSLAISVWFAGEMANVYSLFANTGPFTSVANSFPAVNTLYNNYTTITALLGGLMIVLLYGKTRQGREVTV